MSTLADLSVTKLAAKLSVSNDIIGDLTRLNLSDDVLAQLIDKWPIWVIRGACYGHYGCDVEYIPVMFFRASSREHAIRQFVSTKTPVIGRIMMNYWNSFIAYDCYHEVYRKFIKLQNFNSTTYNTIIDDHFDEIVDYFNKCDPKDFYCEKIQYNIAVAPFINVINEDFTPDNTKYEYNSISDLVKLSNGELQTMFDKRSIWLIQYVNNGHNIETWNGHLMCVRADNRTDAIKQFIATKSFMIGEALIPRYYNVKEDCKSLYYRLKAIEKTFEGPEYEEVLSRYESDIIDYFVKQNNDSSVFLCAEIKFGETMLELSDHNALYDPKNHDDDDQ